MPKYSPELIKKIESAQQLTKWLLDNQPLRYKATERSRIAGAFLSIALDHHVGIIHLLSSQMPSPAFSLARSVWEAYVRGLWAADLATDNELSDFIDGRNEPKMNSLIKLVKKHPDIMGENIIAKTHELAWGSLNAFSHGGLLQVLRWITAESVEPTHSDNDIVSLMRFVNQAAFLAGFGLVELAEAVQLNELFVEKAKELASNDWC